MSHSLFSRKHIVGLDVGHRWIRVADVHPSGNGWHISRCGKIETPPDSVKEGVVVDPASVGSEIRQLLRDMHISPSSAAMAVGGGTVMVRVVRMPQMSETTLRKSIRFEAGRYVPTSVDDSYIEFEIIEAADENQMDVLMVAAPKDVVDSRTHACELAGLECAAVDVETFSAYRTLIESNPDSEWQNQTVALLDIGGGKTNLSVIRGGVFVMTRSLPQGGQLLTEALMQYFKLSEEEAEQGKAQLDLRLLINDSGPQENPPLRVVQPHVDDLVREVRRSLNYYQSQLAEGEHSKNVDAVLITGGGAKLAGLDEYMEHKLKLPTKTLGLFSNSRFVHGDGGDESDGLELSVVAGLAMRSHFHPHRNAA